MKIIYLKLKNFVNIISGMKKSEIEIDFSKSKNKLIVLSGKNGSGKTSILSELHPFASCGNMDVRSDVCLIKEGCDGYKEIHIQDKKDMYIIKHYYLFKNKNKSVKSYISKNGKELNDNGNVKSFKEQVYLNLGIDQDLLKLMRLGSNVTSLINMKATSRKSFATKLFSDIDIYESFYKKVSNEYRNVRAVMKNISEKISQYNVTDISDFNNEIRIITDRIQSNEYDKNKLIKDIAINETKLKGLVCSDYNEVLENYNNLNNTITTSENKLVLVKDIYETEKEYRLLSEKNITKLDNEIQQNESKIDKELSEKNIYYDQIQELEEKLKTAVSVTRLQHIEDSIKDYDNQISILEKKLKDRIQYDKNELMRVNDNIRMVTQAYKSLNVYKTKNVRFIAKLMLNNNDVKKELLIYKSKLEEELETLSNNSTKRKFINKLFDDDKINFKCDTICPYMSFYNKLMEELDEYNNIDDKILDLKKQLSEYEELYDIYRVLTNIEEIINNVDINSNIPIEYNINVILNNIIKNKLLVNSSMLNLAIDDAESFELLDNYKKNRDNIINEYQTIKDFGLDNITIENKIIKIKDNIIKNDNNIKKYQNNIKELRQRKEELMNRDNDILQALTLREQLDSIKKEFIEVEYRLKEIKHNIELKEQLEHSNEQLNSALVKINSNIQLDNKHKEELDYKLKEYSNLTNEYQALNLLFKDINEIRDALNASTGIPLVYLNVYLKNCPILMNTLLESVFDGQLQIDGFIINENEFRIPFITKGILVPDIINASQGESSFISIVLSLSLIIQSMTNYDIICLDELDGPLDNKNRQEFINILYKFIEQVNCEQVFLITHNNMFDNEPVDLILTSETDVDNFKYGNIIFKK